ncbi:MAG: response regulator [Inquilinus sp.]|nr:response regulator [Inquilinus sp.]
MRVLYVEDDNAMAVAVANMLRRAGYHCDVARLGREAVTVGLAGEYDVILLDIDLPDIDGYQVVEHLRSGGVRTPVVMQTGLVDPHQDGKGASLGVEDYLLKPFNRESVIGAVEAAIARGRAAAEAERPASPETSMDRPSRPLLAGRAIFDDGRPAIECTIVSVTSDGAALRVDGDPTGWPEAFVLSVPGDKGYRCRTCWQTGDKIGVRFA